MKKYKIAFWVSTVFIFVMEGVIPLLTGHSEMAVDGITALGYPVYFVTMLVVAKVLGSLALIIPQVPNNVKEWAYAGFGINFISASISSTVVYGLGGLTFFPLFFFVVLIISYISRRKLESI